MSAAGRGGILVVLVVLSTFFAWTGASNSGGAPQNAAEGGCTCHNAAPDPSVQVRLEGLPEVYAAGATYDLALSVAGGPTALPAVSQNQGGFALKVSAGLLLAEDGISITGGTFATHSSSTNDQRSWGLQWVAPENASAPVTFAVAANSVNGDGVNVGDLDQWNKVVLTVAPMVGGGPVGDNGTVSPGNGTDGPGESQSPALPVLVSVAAVLGIVLWRRRSA